MADELRAETIERALGGGLPLKVLDETDSTNEEAWRWLDAGAPEGAVVVADHQTGGRGRRGRSWVAPPGTGLLFSVVLRPELEGDGLSLLTTAVGIACAETIREQASLPVRLKWPNDVVYRGQKLAGILVESRRRGDDNTIVAGVGINVATTLAELPAELRSTATSIAIERPEAGVRRSELLAGCLRSFRGLYAGLGEVAARADLVRRATKLSDSIGRGVRIRYPDGQVREGVAAGLAPSGALLLVTGGERVEVAAGEIENVRSA